MWRWNLSRVCNGFVSHRDPILSSRISWVVTCLISIERSTLVSLVTLDFFLRICFRFQWRRARENFLSEQILLNRTQERKRHTFLLFWTRVLITSRGFLSIAWDCFWNHRKRVTPFRLSDKLPKAWNRDWLFLSSLVNRQNQENGYTWQDFWEKDSLHWIFVLFTTEKRVCLTFDHKAWLFVVDKGLRICRWKAWHTPLPFSFIEVCIFEKCDKWSNRELPERVIDWKRKRSNRMIVVIISLVKNRP
jgi:hypothetical protein